MNQRASSITWGVIVVILLAIISFLIVSSQNITEDKSLVTTQNIVSTPTNKSIDDESKVEPIVANEEGDWKTFTSGGFPIWMIKYDPSLILSGNCMDIVSKCMNIGISDDGHQVISISYDGALSDSQTLEQYAKERYELNEYYASSSPEEVTFGSNKGFAFTVNTSYIFNGGQQSDGTTLSDNTKVVFFQTKTRSRVIRVMINENKPLYTEVVKTLEIID